MLKNFLLLATALAIGVAIVEVGMRIARLSYPNLYMPDEFVGSALRPGAAGWWRREGLAHVRINSVGLRDREYSQAKPANTLRIAVLGDSFAEALQIPSERAFWSILERVLAICGALGGREVEAINFGKSGRGTAEELLTFRHYAAKYSPDIVVLTFWPGNDIRNNSRELEPDKLRPFFVYDDGKLVLDNSFREDPGFKAQLRTTRRWEWRVWNWLRDRLRVVQLLDYVQDQIGRGGLASNREAEADALQIMDRDRNEPSAPARELGVSTSAVYSQPQDQRWREAWQITEQLIEQTRNEVIRTGAQFLVVLVSTSAQVHPDPGARQAFARHKGVPDLLYSNRRIGELALRAEIAVLDLVPAMQNFAERTGQCLHGFDNTTPCAGHWNVAGHLAAGTLIGRYMCQNLIFQGQR